MANLYHKKRSPFWYIQYVDSERKKRDKSTGLRKDDPNDTVKAKILRAELEAKEFRGANPLTSIKIRRDKPAKKPELTDEDIAEIRHALIQVKKPHLCFHCLRVTYVNRLRRAGVPSEISMRTHYPKGDVR